MLPTIGTEGSLLSNVRARHGDTCSSESLVNRFRKLDRMVAVAVNTDRICPDPDMAATNDCDLLFLDHLHYLRQSALAVDDQRARLASRGETSVRLICSVRKNFRCSSQSERRGFRDKKASG